MADEHEAGAGDIPTVVGVPMGAHGVIVPLIGVSADDGTRPAPRTTRGDR